MKFSQITENEYDGLEDNDEFGEESLGNCTQCNRDVPAEADGVWTCWDCEAVAHFSCAMPAQEDIPTYDIEPEGIMSSGWYFRRQNSYLKNSDITRAGRNWNVLQRGRVLAAARAYDKFLCPTCAQHLTEDANEYAGLEDNDKFEDPRPMDECWGCTQAKGFSALYDQDEIDGPCNCGVTWCEWCVSKSNRFDFIPEFNKDGSENRNAGEMVGCPRCKNIVPGVDVWESVGEYDGLEDDDEFEDEDPEAESRLVDNELNQRRETPASLGIPPDRVIDGVQLSDGSTAYWSSRHESWFHENDVDGIRMYGFVNESNEYAGLEDNDEFKDNSFCWCGNEWEEGDRVTYCYKCNQSMCIDCSSYRPTRRTPDRLAGGYKYICQDCIADEDFTRENIRESEYAGLEDNDEFDQTSCDEGCDEDFGRANCSCSVQNHVERCNTCDACYCRQHWQGHQRREILAHRNSTTEPFITSDGQTHDLDYNGEEWLLDGKPFLTGIIQDHFTIFKLVPCEGGDNWGLTYFDAVTESASEYAGLEDNDEFEDNDEYRCVCGAEGANGEEIDHRCSGCWYPICALCGGVYTVFETYKSTFCHNCARGVNFVFTSDLDGKSYLPPRRNEDNLRESEYDGLEDNDEFEDDDLGTCDQCHEREHTFRCDGCRAVYLCSNCIDSYDLEDSSGQLIVCPNCKRSQAAQEILNNPRPMAESEYDGLEDNDEFEDDEDSFDEQEINAMNEMGQTPDSLGIPSELQLHGVELSSGARAYWININYSLPRWPETTETTNFRWVHEDDTDL